ncbi:hypothetical protein GCM10020254_56670 [Streptomyces goshikiensis]
MLHPQPGPEHRMVGGRHVPHGEDVRVGRAQRGVHRDPAAVLPVHQGQPGGLGERGARRGPDRREHRVRRVLLPVVRTGRQHHAVLADDLRQPGPEVEADPVVLVQVPEEPADLRAEHRVQRGGLRLDHRDLRPVPARRGGDLQADPPGARDQQVAVVPAEPRQRVAQPFGVRQPAQVVDPGQARARDVQAARLGAGRQQQLVVVQRGAVAEDDLLLLPDQVDRGLAEVQLDVGARVPGRLVHEDALALLLARQVALGQRGAVRRDGRARPRPGSPGP